MEIITPILYILLGILSAAVSYLMLRKLLLAPAICNTNYAGRNIASLGGLVALTALFVSQLLASLIQDSGTRTNFAQTALIITLGYAFIGLLDDLLGDKERQGFKGHVSALLKGNLTTGAIKLFGGPCIAFFAFAQGIESRGFVPVIIDSLCVALIANTFNLLDLAPGRTTKYMMVFGIGVLIANPDSSFLFAILGVLFVCMIFDVREQFMLGDTGANLFGALLGFYFVSNASDEITAIALGIVFALNLLSEFVSFSAIIAKVWPLRMFDYLGQTKNRRDWAQEKRLSK